jgi:hypothetical protein
MGRSGWLSGHGNRCLHCVFRKDPPLIVLAVSPGRASVSVARRRIGRALASTVCGTPNLPHPELVKGRRNAVPGTEHLCFGSFCKALGPTCCVLRRAQDEEFGGLRRHQVQVIKMRTVLNCPHAELVEARTRRGPCLQASSIPPKPSAQTPMKDMI